MRTINGALYPLALTLLLTLLPACTADRALLTAQRPPETPFRSEPQKEISSISFGFETTADDLARVLNRTIARELHRGPVKNSGVTATVLRNGPIVISMADDYIHLTLPITMSLAYGIFKTPDTPFRLKFRARPAISGDWRIIADVQYTGLEDLLSGEIGIGLLTINPRSTAEAFIQPLQKSISALVSKQINEQFPLKSYLSKAWAVAQKPVLLEKNHHAWLMLSPKEVILTPFQAHNNRATLGMGINTYAELVIGPEPADAGQTPLPPLQRVNTLNREFHLSMKADLFYREIVAILSPLILGKDFGSDGNSVIVKNFDLYGNGDRIIVRLETGGDLAGSFYLTGKPLFDPRTNLFSVEEVDFDMNSESLLLTSADWFLHGSFRERLHEKLRLDLSARINEAREMAHKGLGNIELAEHVFLRGSVTDLGLREVLVLKDRIALRLRAKGEANLVLK